MSETRKQYDSFEEYEAAWFEAMRAAGHEPQMEDGAIDKFVVSSGYHNGPGCAKCGESWCYHCASPEQIAKKPCAGEAHKLATERAYEDSILAQADEIRAKRALKPQP